MKPAEREVEYLSPSSFLLLESDPIAFYKKKVRAAPYVKEESFPMRVGWLVDAMFGCLWRQEGVPKEWPRDEAFELAKSMFFSYIANGGWDRLLNLGIAEIQRELWGEVPGTDIPIHGFADVVTVAGCILDWKTSGANRPDDPGSPKPGYFWSSWIKSDGSIDAKQHPKFGLTMDQIYEPWAVQLTFYNWILHGEIRPYTSFIHLIQPNARFTEYQGILTIEFQEQLAERVETAWELIQDKKLIPPHMDPDLLDLL